MTCKKYRYWLVLLSLFTSLTSGAQCVTKNNVFGDGEHISYTVSYNWGPVWVDAGIVTFSVKLTDYRGKPAWYIKSTGRTFASYDLLFKVRDTYESWIDPESFKTYEFRRYIYEGGYTLQNTLMWDHAKGRVLSNTKSNNNPMRADTLKVKPCTFDMIAAVYHVRTLDLGSLKPGIQFPVAVLIDDSIYQITIRPAGREVVENTDGKRYNCLKFHARMVNGTIFKGDEDVTVWVTDDANKVPVYIEANILIGTIKAYLRDTKGLKHPVTSRVKK